MGKEEKSTGLDAQESFGFLLAKAGYGQSKYVLKQCPECGQEFSVLRKYAKRPGRGVYCDRSCATGAANRKRKGRPGKQCFGPANPAWKGGVSKDHIRYTERFKKKFPEKAAAHRLVRRAIRSGVLIRQPCQQCGGIERIHAHHDDYTKPLDVIWLCQPCHLKHHHRLSQEVQP